MKKPHQFSGAAFLWQLWGSDLNDSLRTTTSGRFLSWVHHVEQIFQENAALVRRCGVVKDHDYREISTFAFGARLALTVVNIAIFSRVGVPCGCEEKNAFYRVLSFCESMVFAINLMSLGAFCRDVDSANYQFSVMAEWSEAQ